MKHSTNILHFIILFANQNGTLYCIYEKLRTLIYIIYAIRRAVRTQLAHVLCLLSTSLVFFYLPLHICSKK